ncbi:MAG: bifunctional adenosylcobinamide kinase/adenosylcobinamide-phosphate guanylyltransferase [Lachnospiraceae bacterium]|nr:bifunctional adenosylcobinamide kinase/adenosylcobinamide-phosphate guanylyltransferase [Lachnospiraceae bacterium]
MVVFVTGKPDSGKSKIAEDRAVQMAEGDLYYLATMKICDEEGKRRVEKHRLQRAGKGFVTIECLYEIRQVIGRLRSPAKSTVLLECIPNLVANEMFENPDRSFPTADGVEAFLEPLYKEICGMAKEIGNLVIVSAEYDAVSTKGEKATDAETAIYLSAISAMNRRLTDLADEVVRT